MNLDKEFIPYEQALALKELGFDEPCFGSYDPFGSKQLSYNGIYIYGNCIAAPTFSQAFRWFREKYNINIWIDSRHTSNLGERRYIQYSPIVDLPNQINLLTLGYFKTYEEAELACLKKLIEIIKAK